MRAIIDSEDWSEEEPGDPSFELAHFHRGLNAIDQALADGNLPRGKYPLEALFRGPLADSMTHVGQLAMIRRLAGSPVADVEFWAAVVKPGTVLFELGGVSESVAKDIFRRQAMKLPVKVRMVRRRVM